MVLFLSRISCGGGGGGGGRGGREEEVEEALYTPSGTEMNKKGSTNLEKREDTKNIVLVRLVGPREDDQILL